MPSVGPYCSARADESAATRAMSAARSSAGKVLVSGQPAGERDDLGPRGDRHQVAHRGGLHALRAAREQPGVALEVARRASATGPYRGIRRQSPGPLASRLSSCRLGHPSAHGLHPRSPPGSRSGGRDRHPAVPAGAARGRARVGRRRARLQRDRLRVPRDMAVPARRAGRWSSRSTRRLAAPAAMPPTGRRCSTRCSALALVLGALVAAGSVADRSGTGGPARSSAWPAPRSASRPRARCSAACAAGSTTRRRARCRCTPRARRWPPRASRSCSRRWRMLVIGALVWLLAGGRRRAGEKYAGLRILR